MIRFYSRSDPCFELTNYQPSFFVDEKGREFFHVEGYFHFKKFEFTDPVWAEHIRRQHSPSEAKRLGSSREHPIHKDWEDVRLQVMRDAIRFKFDQNPKLKTILLGTGSNILIEKSPTDYFWGEGLKRSGHNHLGRLLMEYRDSQQLLTSSPR